MWPIGHAAVGYLCYSAWTRRRGEPGLADLPVLVLLFGSQFPDLVDKPLAWYLGVLPHGRTLGHTLLVLVPLCVLVYTIAARYDRSECGIAFAIGALSHSIVDALPALWLGPSEAGFLLWPLVGVEPYEDGPPSITALFLESLGDPYFLSEFVFLVIALVVWRRDGYPGISAIHAVADRAFNRR